MVQPLGQTEVINGVTVDTSFMFANHKGEHKRRIEKRQRALLEKVSEVKRFLQKDERVLLVSTGCSPMSMMEQFLTGWMVYYMKRAVFVFTNKRILHIPSTTGYKYRNSIAQIRYADCEVIRQKGHVMAVKFQGRGKEKFYYMGRAERKKIASLAKTVSPDGAASATPARVHLCPRCGTLLTKGSYVCRECRLEFKDMATAKKLSVLLPGGGYFYAGRPVLGLMDAVTEIILIIMVIGGLLSAIEGSSEGMAMLITGGILLVFEKLMTIYHAGHFIKEYVPTDKDFTPRVAET
jgi:hypothetical protein